MKKTTFLLPFLTFLTFFPFLVTSAAPFPDAPSDAWFTPYVEELHQQGLIQGYPDGRFGSWDPVNRAELSKIIVNLEKNLQQKLGAKTEAISWWEDHSFELILLAITILGWLSVVKIARRPMNLTCPCHSNTPHEPKTLNELNEPNSPNVPNEPHEHNKPKEPKTPPPNWWL